MKSKQTTFDRLSFLTLPTLAMAIAAASTGCHSPTSAADGDANIQTGENNAEPEVTEEPKKRLKRGEIPEDWIEPQRERVIPALKGTDGKLDLTFDDLKFDIEVGEAFDRSKLSDEVKAYDGKEITLSGYMRPAFQSTGIRGFIFVRDDKECCFGPQAAIYDCVRVYLKKGTKTDYLVRPFKVRGKFFLKEKEGPDGAVWSIFNMKNAKIER